MRILPVNFLYPYSSQNRTSNIKYSYYNTYDTVCFTAKNHLMTGKDLKKLNRYMTCLYSGDKMLSHSQLKKMKTRGLFQGTVSEFVRKLQPYKNRYLKSVELEVFNRIEQAAKKNPDITTSQLLKNWYSETRSKVRKQQKPNFDTIKTLGAKLPQEYIEPFFNFMAQTDKKLYDQPVLQKFSFYDFEYKIKKATEKMEDWNFKNRIDKLLEVLSAEMFHNEKPIPEKIIKRIFGFMNLKVAGKKSDFYKKHLKKLETDKDAVKIRLIEDMLNTARLKGYKKIEHLCENNINMLKGIPIKVPFSNKAFIYDLNKVLEGMPDKELKSQMLDLAQHLPTSRKSPEALILKLNDVDPNIIGDRLFDPSLVSIEHLKPSSEGGIDSIANCALAKRGLNSARQSQPLWQTLLNFPLKNQQKYANNLIKLVNAGKMRAEDALSQIRTIEQEGHIKLNISKLFKQEY